MTKVEIELFFKGIFATEIEDGEGNYFSNFDEDFTIHRLKGTETLDPDELTQFIKDNLKVIWDGSLDNPQHFKSYNITKMVGPAFASYDVGLNLKSVSLFLDVEITTDDPDEVDFDDLFHAIVFELSDGVTTIMLTEFENYSANILTE